MWKLCGRWLSSIFSIAVIACSNGSKVDPEPTAHKEKPENAKQTDSLTVARESVNAITDDTIPDVGKVTKMAAGSHGAPVIVLEENHSSRAVQLQEAIVLDRLYQRHRLRHVGLEGYIKDGTSLVSSAFATKAASHRPKDEVAVTMLREGEISSAEFMQLAHDDVRIIPVEIASEWQVEAGDAGAAFGTMSNIVEKALTSLSSQQQKELDTKLQNIDKNLQRDDRRYREEVETATYAAVESAHPGLKACLDAVRDPQKLLRGPLEPQIELLSSLDALASTVGVTLDNSQRHDTAVFLNFLTKRSSASRTMANSIGSTADQMDIPVVALIVGAAHTDGVVDQLVRANRPYAVIRPSAMDESDDYTHLDAQQFGRRTMGVSIVEGVASAALERAFPDESNAAQRQPRPHHHPPPVIQRRWFQAKSEMYDYTNRITQAVLGNGNGGARKPPFGKPPYGFAADDFRGKLVYVDPRKIEIVTEANGRHSVLFPVILNPDDASRRETLWVKAGLIKDEAPPPSEKTRVEQMLMGALEDVHGKRDRGHGESESGAETRKRGEDEHETAGRERDRADHEQSRSDDHGVETAPSDRIKVARSTVASIARERAVAIKANVTEL